MFVGVRPRKRAPVAPSAGSAPCPTGSSLEPQAQGACAEGGAQALGRCSQRLRRAAASLARTDAIVSHLPDKHHENSAAHTVIAAPAAGRASTPPSRGARARARARSPSAPAPPRRQPLPTAAGRTPGLGGGQRAAECPRAASAPPPSGVAGSVPAEARGPCSRSAPGPRRLPGRRLALWFWSRPQRADAVPLARPSSVSVQGLARCSRAPRAALPPRWPHLPAVVGALPR